VVGNYLDKMFVYLSSIGIILDECERMGKDQNFMLFPNMSSETLCLFALASSERIFGRLKKLVWTEIFFVYFCNFTLVVQNSTLKFWFTYQIVEGILPYKMHYFDFFVFFTKHLNFCFHIILFFEKLIFFDQNWSHVKLASKKRV
jgi:hypothetical protein